jgi:hypothetical protein
MLQIVRFLEHVDVVLLDGVAVRAAQNLARRKAAKAHDNVPWQLRRVAEHIEQHADRIVPAQRRVLVLEPQLVDDGRRRRRKVLAQFRRQQRQVTASRHQRLCRRRRQRENNHQHIVKKQLNRKCREITYKISSWLVWHREITRIQREHYRYRSVPNSFQEKVIDILENPAIVDNNKEHN